MLETILFTAGAVCAVVVVVRVARMHSARAREATWLPADLIGAKIAFAERQFSINRPARLVSRVDRAYAVDAGYQLMEFKTRRLERVYLSDVIELSVQRMTVAGETGVHVEDTATVVIDTGERRIAKKVWLLTDEKVLAMIKRREGILASTIQPNYAESSALCKHCAYLEECKPDTGSACG